MITTKKLKKIVHPDHVAWMAYRYISIYITKLLIYTPITANQITAFWILLAISSSVMIFFGYYILGGILLTISVILDYVDGEVARYKKTKSVKWGEFFDWIGTWLSVFLPLLALTLNIFLETKDTLFLMFGIFSIFGYAMLELIRLEDIKINPQKAIKSSKEEGSPKKKLLLIYKLIFMIAYPQPIFLLWALLNRLNIIEIEYYLLYYCVGFNLMWTLKVFYELFFGFKNENKSK